MINKAVLLICIEFNNISLGAAKCNIAADTTSRVCFWKMRSREMYFGPPFYNN